MDDYVLEWYKEIPSILKLSPVQARVKHGLSAIDFGNIGLDRYEKILSGEEVSIVEAIGRRHGHDDIHFDRCVRISHFNVKQNGIEFFWMPIEFLEPLEDSSESYDIDL